MAPAPVVVVADLIDAVALEQLRAGGLTVTDVSGTPDRLKPALSGAWGLIVRSRTKVTRELLSAAPNLKVVARAGVGVDNIDVPAATAAHVLVINAPTAATVSVAELSVALYLLLLRDLLPAIESTKAGEWKRGTRGHELAGRVVGFVGYGRIAREIAARLRPFRVRALAYDPYVTQSPDSTQLVTLDDLLCQSDIVSINAALTKETEHLLGADQIAKMRAGAYLVNVARGTLVDENALLHALDSGAIAGAALDVFESEPPKDRRLVEHPKVIATPHLGASTHEAQEFAGRQVVDELLRCLRGEPLNSLVNPEAAKSPG